MFNIIENTYTQELFFKSNQKYSNDAVSTFDFGGREVNQHIDNWKVVASGVHSVTDWQTNPGNYGTFSMVATICLIPNRDSVPTKFTMGGTLTYILNWVEDAKTKNFYCFTQNERAYSSRNTARQLAQVKV